MERLLSGRSTVVAAKVAGLLQFGREGCYSTMMKFAPLRLAVVMLSGLYLLGVVFLLFLPETKGQPLPED